MKEASVESIIAKLLSRYEKGSVTRRELIQGLAFLTAAATTKSASADNHDFEVVGFDHLQINASNAAESGAWYRKMFGMIQIRAGAMTDDSEEIAHAGTKGNLLLSFRKLKPAGKVDHIGIRIASGGPTGDEVKEIIESRGGVFHPPDPDAAPGSYLHDPDGIRIQVGTKGGTKPY